MRLAALIVLFLIVLGAAVSKTVWANGDEEEGEEEGEFAEGLGEVAWNLGLALNLAFVAVRWSRRYLAFPPQFLKLALDVHMYGNVALAVPALLHGYVFLDKAGPVEYATGLIIVVLIASGLVLRYARYRGLRRAMKLIHSQRALSLLLLALLLIHTAVAED